jgi:hypothetical protein
MNDGYFARKGFSLQHEKALLPLLSGGIYRLSPIQTSGQVRYV